MSIFIYSIYLVTQQTSKFEILYTCGVDLLYRKHPELNLLSFVESAAGLLSSLSVNLTEPIINIRSKQTVV